MFSLEIFKNSFFVEHLTVHYTFSKFYVMTEFSGRLWVQNWHYSYFLCHCFGFLHACFHIEVFSKCNFRSSTTLIVSSPSNLLWKLWTWVFLIFPAGIYLLKVNDRNTRIKCEICSKLTIKILERRRSSIFIVNFEHISHFILVFLSLTLSR